MSATPGDEPRLWLPRPPLRDYIEYFGYWQRASGEPHRSRALPRGAATVVIDISGRERAQLCTGDGRTLLPVPAAFVEGAGTTSHVTRIDAAQAVVTIHFRPGGALPFLGVPLGELENSCVGLEDLLGPDSAALHERLITTPSAESADHACRVIPPAAPADWRARTAPRGHGRAECHRARPVDARLTVDMPAADA